MVSATFSRFKLSAVSSGSSLALSLWIRTFIFLAVASQYFRFGLSTTANSLTTPRSYSMSSNFLSSAQRPRISLVTSRSPKMSRQLNPIASRIDFCEQPIDIHLKTTAVLRPSAIDNDGLCFRPSPSCAGHAASHFPRPTRFARKSEANC